MQRFVGIQNYVACDKAACDCDVTYESFFITKFRPSFLPNLQECSMARNEIRNVLTRQSFLYPE